MTPLIQIGISGESAAGVIAEMRHVLDFRHKGRLTRQRFLKRWHRLRERLSATPEYTAFRNRVYIRDAGLCKECGRQTHEVHHRIRVAMRPELAIEVDNGELLCIACHKTVHPHMRRRTA